MSKSTKNPEVETELFENSEQPEPEAIMEAVAGGAPAPLEPEDLTAFALSEDFHAGAAHKVLTTVPVRKPPRESFVRTHPEPESWQLFALLELKEVGKTYLLMPAVAAALRDEGESTMFQANLVLSVDRRGNPFLWPLKISDRENDWNTSARRAAEMAKTQWLRLAANMAAGSYDVMVAASQDAAPAWPEESYGDILKLGFRDRIITHPEHEILKELRGQF